MPAGRPRGRAALAARDLVLSDHRMPTFDSTGALQILQENGADIPFLIVSGTIGEETAVRAMQLGAKDYALKSNLVRLVPAVERKLLDASVRRAREEAERRQRDAEERYRTLVEQLPAVTYLLSSGAAPRCLYVSVDRDHARHPARDVDGHGGPVAGRPAPRRSPAGLPAVRTGARPGAALGRRVPGRPQRRSHAVDPGRRPPARPACTDSSST